MSDDIMAKFRKAKEMSGSRPRQQGQNTIGMFIGLRDGANRVRIGGSFIIVSQHYVFDILRQECLRLSKSENKSEVQFGSFLTCLNWDIEHEERFPEEDHCCPLCDLREAARSLERNAKNSNLENKEEMIKYYGKVIGLAGSRHKYSWPAILREDPYVTMRLENGTEQKVLGWKILNLGKEAFGKVETLFNQYNPLFDVEEGCDIDIFKTKGVRTSYAATFALNGPSIAVTKLTDAEREMQMPDLKRYVSNHVSPRELFKALKNEYQELITSTLEKDESSYPDEHPVKRTNGNGASQQHAPVVKKAATEEKVDMSGEFEEESTEEAPPVPVPAKHVAVVPEVAPKPKTAAVSPPKPPAPPKPVSVPKPPAPPKSVTAPKPVASPTPKPAEKKPEAPLPDVRPACFGTCDKADAECKKCQIIEACSTNPKTK